MRNPKNVLNPLDAKMRIRRKIDTLIHCPFKILKAEQRVKYS